jgi:flagellar motor switch protein FliM
MMELKVGDTLMFDLGPDAPVRLKCGDVFITEGRMGRVGEKIAIRVLRQLKKSKTTFAAYEASAAAPKDK